MEIGGGVDRHLFILDLVFARLYQVHIINTRGNSLRRPPPWTKHANARNECDRYNSWGEKLRARHGADDHV